MDRSLSLETELERYVSRADDSYSWRIIGSHSTDGLTTYIVELVSQKWRTEEEVDRPLWRHWLIVVKPAEVTSDIGFLHISSGSNNDARSEEAPDLIKQIAFDTKTVVAELGMIPNQPLVFHDDGIERDEDDLVAYTWDQYLKTGDATWPARNPMVKSALRALDTITALMADDRAGNQAIDKFVVAGGSKRGWTAWLTAALDQRVVAVIPVAIDAVNIEKTLRHHYASYGCWAPSHVDYVRHRIMERMDDPRFQELCRLVDPYCYRHRLTLPKFVVNAAGDEYFLPDSSRFYFDDLEEEKLLRYVPNADHSLNDSDAIESIIAYYWMLLNGKERPEYSWTFEDERTIRVVTQQRPQAVNLWQANNPNARDFRLATLGPSFMSNTLEDEGEGVYLGRVEEPKTGWTAFFIELTYDVGAPYPLKLTTEVRIVPDRLPHANKPIENILGPMPEGN